MITGIAGSIGNAAALLFSQNGWHVVGADIREPDDSSGIDRFIRIDLGDAAGICDLFGSITEKEGQIDALINNAAIQICKPIADITTEEWDHLINVNLRAPFLAARSALTLMRKKGGAIVNISSVHAIATSNNMAVYAASKGGLVALTKGLAIEFAPYNIRVNALLPGAVDTQMLRDGVMRDRSGMTMAECLEELAAKTVMNRIGHPSEIARAIWFLTDNKSSSFMTGQILVLDGGATARLSTE